MALVIADLFKGIAGYTQIKTILQKCQSVSVFIHRSEINETTLKEACELTETLYHVPVLAVNTRWNSSDENVASNLKLEKPLRHLSDTDTSKEQNWRKKVLSPLEYEAAKGLHRALKPFKIATKIFEADTIPTIHKVIPGLFEISDQLRRMLLEEGIVSEFAGLLKNAFDKRYPECGARNKVYAVSHFLDPAYQGCVLEVYPNAYDEAREELLKLLKDLDKSSAPAAAASADAVTGYETEMEDDSDLSAVERLRKRRRVSRDSEERQPRTQSIPAPELEIQTYEKLQVIIRVFRK